ncbi:MAG: prepilin peptidase [Acidobacteria bacterium]|nr:prepilin peptidase [Acidobacteriota bacterium]
MTTIPVAVEGVLAGTVLAAAATDLRSRNIPNWLTLGAMAAGFVLNTWLRGWPGLKFAALGFGLAALIFIPLFVMRWLGGGDVKLMAAVGALAGSQNLLAVFLLDAVLGGAVAVGVIVAKGKLWRTLKNLPRIFSKDRPAELQAGHEESVGMPRAVTIAAATLIVLWMLNR